jgi:hypothetical protein
MPWSASRNPVQWAGCSCRHDQSRPHQVGQGRPRLRSNISGESHTRLELVLAAPAIRGEYLKINSEMQEALAQAIATRTGTDIGQDMYPRILAGAVIAAAQVAVRRWAAADPPVPLGPLLRGALEQLATACSQPPASE